MLIYTNKCWIQRAGRRPANTAMSRRGAALSCLNSRTLIMTLTGCKFSRVLFCVLSCGIVLWIVSTLTAPRKDHNECLVLKSVSGHHKTVNNQTVREVSALERLFRRNNRKLSNGPSTALDPARVQNNVFYVWCGKNRAFEFRHYLSALSVILELQPTAIYFHYATLPEMDKMRYNTWFDELKAGYPFLHLSQSKNCCSELDKPNIAFVYDQLSKFGGGIFLNENTIFSGDVAESFRNFSVVDALDRQTLQGFLWSKDNYSSNIDNNTRLRFNCRLVNLTTPKEPCSCFIMEKSFFPKDIWTSTEADKDQFKRVARRIFYGSPEEPLPKPTYDELVPNIAHLMWVGGGEMDFLFYLNVLSLLYVGKMDRVYIHGDLPPKGVYWDKVKNESRLTCVHRVPPSVVYGNAVNNRQHMSDLWRAEFLVKYGGIYLDTDAVLVRPLDRRIRGYDAIGTFDWPQWELPFQDTINFGVAVGKRNSKYWRLLLESARAFDDNDGSWNGLRQPYKALERHPRELLIEPHLQVICFMGKCHPTWWPDYHNESLDHITSKTHVLDWRKDSYAFHWTFPNPPELTNFDELNKSDTMFAQIGKFILKEAGILR